MCIGFGQLKLSPKAFWSMTPLEFNEACRGIARANGYDQNSEPPITQEQFEALKRQFPDGKL